MTTAAFSLPPSLGLLGMEPLRACFEYAGMHLMDRSLLPAGDGHPVVFFPGLATDRRAIAPLRNCCERLGYSVYDWELGFNTGPQGLIDEWLQGLVRHVEAVSAEHGRPASLVGWSLGGIYAREIAKMAPASVRQVVTLGTPFASTGQETNVGWLYNALNGSPPALDAALSMRLRTTPVVPTTSVYSRSDGVVSWKACLLRPTRRAENIEVDGSHIGLPWNPKVIRVVADRLAQAEGAWRRYGA